MSPLVKKILQFAPSKLIPPIINLIGITVLANFLKPDLFGRYILIIATIQALTFIITGWISHSFYRYVNLIDNTLRSTLLLNNLLLCFLLFIPLSALFLSIIDISYNISLLLASCLLYLSYTLYEIKRSLLEVRLEAKKLFKLSIGSSFFSYFVSILYIKYTNQVNINILIFLFASGKIIPFSKYYFIELNSYSFSFFRRKRYKYFNLIFLRYGIPLGIATIGHQLMSVSDRYFLEFSWGSDVVGIYSANYEIFFKVITNAFPFIAAGSMPYMIKCFDNKEYKSAYNIARVTKSGVLLLVLPLIVYGTLLYNDYIVLIFEESYHISEQNVFIILFAATIWVLIGYEYRIIRLFKETYIIGALSIVAGIINLFLNYILIPVMNIDGAVLATLFSYYTLYLFLCFYVNRKIKEKMISFIYHQLLIFILFLAIFYLSWVINYKYIISVFFTLIFLPYAVYYIKQSLPIIYGTE